MAHGVARSTHERGQVLPLVAVVLVLAAVVMAGAVRLGRAVRTRASAQAAADAAALAGAAGGEEAARRMAARNGARLVQYREVPPAVQVVVVRAGARAEARAEWRPGPRLRTAATRPVHFRACLQSRPGGRRRIRLGRRAGPPRRPPRTVRG